MTQSSDRIVLAGGSGFLGSVLADWFTPRYDVVVLTRQPDRYRGPARAIAWDGRSPGPWCEVLEQASAVINLAGRSVNCRYHARNRDRMMPFAD